jgi:hypothetical protein
MHKEALVWTGLFSQVGYLIYTQIGRAPVQEISHGASTSVKRQPPHISGYTGNHANFQREAERYKKKAGGFVGSSTTTVQVKVTMVRPTKRGGKIGFTPIDEVTSFLAVRVGFNRFLAQDLWAMVFVPANVGMETLRDACLEKLRPTWNRWSYQYAINEGDVTLHVTIPKGYKALFGNECILDLFVKKSRGSTAVANYDFSLVLEITLHLLHTFCEAVTEHRLVEESKLHESAEGSAIGMVEPLTQAYSHTRKILPLPQRARLSAGPTDHASARGNRTWRSTRGLERSLSDLSLDTTSHPTVSFINSSYLCDN